jgi:hypothetical protein
VTGGRGTRVRRAGPGDAAAMAVMRYDFRTELAAPAEGDVMELRWAAPGSA